MTRLVWCANLILLFGSVSRVCFGQSSGQAGSGQGASSSASASAGQLQAQDGTAAAPTDAKKKKVWTNDDMNSLNGPVSVVGDSKRSGKAATTGTSADAQYIANTKKELEKLQSQLDDAKKQITAYRDFEQGKAPEPTGYQIGKGYNRVPVDQQIASLEEKKKQLEGKISDLLDEARKKGVLPGQLR